MALSPTIRNAYSQREPSKTNIKKFGASLTVQDQAPSTNINNIMKRFTKTGLIDHVAAYEPRYGDFAQLDYHTHMERIKEAENAFQELPAQIRKEFDNNIENWLNHLANPDNIEDMKDGQIDNPIQNQAAETSTTESSAASSESASGEGA